MYFIAKLFDTLTGGHNRRKCFRKFAVLNIPVQHTKQIPGSKIDRQVPSHLQLKCEQGPTMIDPFILWKFVYLTILVLQ